MTSRKPAEAHKRAGAPTTYNRDIAERLCVRLALGESLKRITSAPDMPGQSTVYQWLFRHPEFAEMYARAREEQAETHADEIVEIADQTPETSPVYDRDGNLLEVKLDTAYIQWQRQRVDARKWNAAKQRPRKYGDRVAVAGDYENPVQVEHYHDVFGELLKNLKMQRQAE